jgi:signal peptidase
MMSPCDGIASHRTHPRQDKRQGKTLLHTDLCCWCSRSRYYTQYVIVLSIDIGSSVSTSLNFTSLNFTLLYSLSLLQVKYNSIIMIKEIFDKQLYELRKLWANKRQLTFQVLNLAMIVFSALMIWKGLMFVTKSESPVVVVLFQRGDILFLNNAVTDVHVGDVVVFKIKDRDIPIVHRILEVHKDEANGEVEFLTKGDNNRVDDRGLYAPGQLWLNRDDILGRAVGTLRYVGMVTIALNEYPVLKYVLVGMMGLFVLTSKEG